MSQPFDKTLSILFLCWLTPCNINTSTYRRDLFPLSHPAPPTWSWSMYKDSPWSHTQSFHNFNSKLFYQRKKLWGKICPLIGIVPLLSFFPQRFIIPPSSLPPQSTPSLYSRADSETVSLQGSLLVDLFIYGKPITYINTRYWNIPTFCIRSPPLYSKADLETASLMGSSLR